MEITGGISIAKGGYCEDCRYFDPVLDTLEFESGEGINYKEYEITCTHSDICSMWHERMGDLK